MAEEQQAQENQEAQHPIFNIEKIYVKDLSLEAPNAPAVFLQKETPQVGIELQNKAVLVLTKIYHPEGFNLGANIGAAAGAGIEEHLHFHIVPRWVGDTNFTATVGELRVLPETLEETWNRVHAAWK